MSRRARELLDAATSRRAIKRLAATLDGDVEIRQELVELARARGVDLPDEAVNWPGKRLLRRARGRDGDAQIRTNPIARDEAFQCVHCAAEISPHGRSARDHCPECLRSLHVDVIPGDRAETCRGILDPVAVERRGSRTMIHFRCRSCGTERINQALTDGESPDRWDRVIALPGIK